MVSFETGVEDGSTTGGVAGAAGVVLGSSVVDMLEVGELCSSRVMW